MTAIDIKTRQYTKLFSTEESLDKQEKQINANRQISLVQTTVI